ncbi:MAG: hypothetical protein RIC14_05975 [Filomicrobium sp.]
MIKAQPTTSISSAGPSNDESMTQSENQHGEFHARPRVAALVLILATALTLAIPVAAPTLNGISVLGLPLGYYFAAQGGLLLVGLLAIWLSGPWNRTSRHQRVEAFLESLSACGGWLTAGFAATLVGALFVMGHDGLPLFLGLPAGLIVSLVFFAPALDRSGALHMDELLGRLTASHFAAGVAGLGMAAGLVVLMSIELEVAALAISTFAVSRGIELVSNEYLLASLAAAAVIASLIPGRAFWYTLKALALLALAGGIWALVWAATGGQPIGLVPQIAYAPEVAAVTTVERALLIDGLADPVSMPPFARPFVQVSHLNFFVLTLSMMLGAAVMPHLLWRRRTPALGRVATTGSDAVGNPTPAASVVYASRQKSAFSLVVAALVLTAIPALSVFAKKELFQEVKSGIEATAQPDWLVTAQQAGFMRVCKGAPIANAGAEALVAADCADALGRLRVQDLAINGAAVPLIVPALLGLEPMAVLAVSGAIAFLAFFSLAATLRMGIEASTGYSRPLNISRGGDGERRQQSPGFGLHLVIGAVLAAIAVAFVVGLAEAPLNRLYWAFALMGASLFPMVFLLAVWPRISGVALALGGLTGLVACLYYVIGTTSVFAPQFALAWAAVSDAPPWLLDELRENLKTCAQPGADSHEACVSAVELGRELANWFGIDPRAGAVIGAPVGLAVAVFTGLLSPSFWSKAKPSKAN